MSKKRVLINLLAFLLTVFILASSAALATTREDAKLQYFRGINFGMNDKAIVEWQKVLTDFSDQREICADAQLQIGAAYKYMSRFDQAIVEFQKVVNDYPDQRYPRADALYYLGQLYQEKGDLSQAIAAFGSVVSEYSDMGWRAARAKLAMARALDLSGQTDAALEALNGTVMGYSSVRSVCAEAAVEIGQILVSDNKKNYDQAIIQFSEVLNEYKDERAACAQALFGLAKAQERAGKIDDALASYQRLITDFSDVKNQYSVQAYYMKGNLYERIGQKEKAITEYNNIIKFYPSKARGLRVKHKIAALLQTSPVSDDTRAELQTAFEQFSAFQADKSAKEAIEQARTKAMVGDRAGAKADLTALGASEAVNNSIELLGMIARISISFGEKEKAASAFAKQLQLAAAENRPKRYGILRLQSSYFLGDYATAISEAETLLAQYSEDAAGITLRYYMARSYDRMNSVESALAAYDDFISRYSKATDKPTLEMVAMALARSAYRLSGQGKISEAIEKYKRVITECPETEMAFSATNSLKKLEERSGQ